MQCPVCEAENLDDAVECAGCGMTLAAGPGAGEDTPVADESSSCPWCGEASRGAICDACGRRKSSSAAPPPQSEAVASGETVTCPACFARVSREVRCSDCGMPFPLQEL